MQSRLIARRGVDVGRKDGLIGWCESFGLSTSTAQILRSNHFRSVDDVERLNARSIEGLDIAPAEKGLLLGAILQHKVNQQVARMAIEEKEKILREDEFRRHAGIQHRGPVTCVSLQGLSVCVNVRLAICVGPNM